MPPPCIFFEELAFSLWSWIPFRLAPKAIIFAVGRRQAIRRMAIVGGHQLGRTYFVQRAALLERLDACEAHVKLRSTTIFLTAGRSRGFSHGRLSQTIYNRLRPKAK